MPELETIHGPLTTADAEEAIAAWEWYFTRRGPAPLDEEVNSSAHEMAKLSHVVLGELRRLRKMMREQKDDENWYEERIAALEDELYDAEQQVCQLEEEVRDLKDELKWYKKELNTMIGELEATAE